MKRAVAAAMSRLTVWASSIRPVNSVERNPRHQSSVGGASGLVNLAALYPWGMSRAGSGRSWVRMQPAELATMQSAASHLAARSRPGITAGGPAPATPGAQVLTSPSAKRNARQPALRETADRFADDAWSDCLRHVHGVMLPLEPDGHTSRAITARTVLFRPPPTALLLNRERRRATG